MRWSASLPDGYRATVLVASAGNARQFGAAVAESFSGSDSVDVVTAAQKFYQTHEDAYDYLVIFNAEGVSAGSGIVAFEVTARNSRTGYGDTIVDSGQQFGSAQRLQAVLNLGPLSQYPVDPQRGRTGADSQPRHAADRHWARGRPSLPGLRERQRSRSRESSADAGTRPSALELPLQLRRIAARRQSHPGQWAQRVPAL